MRQFLLAVLLFLLAGAAALAQSNQPPSGGGGGGSGTVGSGTGPALAQYPSGTGTAIGPATVSGDCTMAQGGAITCAKTGGAAFSPSATTDATNAANIGSGVLAQARLPAPSFIAHGLAVPATSGFSWINQGGATAGGNTGGPMTVVYPPTSGDQIRLFGQAVQGSAPWTVTAEIALFMPVSNYHIAGIGLSDGTKFITFALANFSGSGPASILIFRWTNATAFSASELNVPFSVPGPVLFLRLYDDGTNMNYSASGDGKTFSPLFSEATGAFLTATTVGIVGDANAADAQNVVNVWGWENVSGSGASLTW